MWIAADGVTVTNSFSFSYDLDGNMLSATNNVGSYILTYNSDDQVIAVQEPFGLGLGFGYDQDGNRTSMSNSLGGVTTSTYYANDMLESRTLTYSGQTLTVGLTYNDDGELATETAAPAALPWEPRLTAIHRPATCR